VEGGASSRGWCLKWRVVPLLLVTVHLPGGCSLWYSIITTLFATTCLTYWQSALCCFGYQPNGHGNEESSPQARESDEAGYKQRKRSACYASKYGRCNSSNCRFKHVCSMETTRGLDIWNSGDKPKRMAVDMPLR